MSIKRLIFPSILFAIPIILYTLLIKDCINCEIVHNVETRSPIQTDSLQKAASNESVTVNLPRSYLSIQKNKDVVFSSNDPRQEMTYDESNNGVDSNNVLIPMPSGNTYTNEYQIQLLGAINGGTLTYEQRRDYFAVLNNPAVPQQARLELHKTMILALRQGRVSMQQFFGGQGTF